MDRMSALDASFWDLESDHVFLHIAAVAVFDGPVPAPAEIAERYAAVVESTPRYRQRMRRVPLGLARPVWETDPTFELGYHLRRTAVPAPGGQDQLLTLVGRLMSEPLDRSRPLWEAWVVEGLADGRWALVAKLHHSMVDGVGGMTLFSGLLDPHPDEARPWSRRPAYEPPPTTLRLVVDALGNRARAGVGAARVLGDIVVNPRRLVTELVVLGRGMPGYLRLLRPAPATSLTGPVGKPRRFRTLTVDLDDVRLVRKTLGGSVNDVVLALVSHGLRELLRRRGEAPERHVIRCLVPVSVRGIGEENEATNRVSALVVDLPVEFGHAEAAYGAVRARMDHLKRSYEAAAGELAVSVAEAVPAAALSAALRTAQHLPHRVITTVTTNVPGPRERVSLLGRPMVALYPYVPIADVLRIGVAVTSYDGHLHFGITCDRDSTGDADVLVAAMADGLTELLKAVHEQPATASAHDEEAVR